MRASRNDPEGSSRDLGLLISGNAISALGNSIYLIAVTLLLKEMTGSAFMLGLFQFMALAPGFLLSPITGVIVDRMSRRRLIILTDLYRGILMIVAGFALMISELSSAWLVLAIAFLTGIGHALFVPAVHALLPTLVPPSRLQTATGLRVASSQIANLGGNAVGGALFALIGAPLLFVVNGASFLVSATQELFIRGGRERIVQTHSESLPAMARTGLRTVVGDRRLRTLLFSQAGLYLVSPVLVISLPFLLIDEMGMRELSLGIYFSLALAGGVVAFAVMRGCRVDMMLRRPLPGFAYLSLAVGFAAAGVLPNRIVLAVVAVISGAAAGSVYLFVTTWILLKCEPGLHGRVFAVMEAVNSVFAPTGYLVAGILLELLGPGHRWVLFAAVAGLSSLWALYLLSDRSRASDNRASKE